MTTPLQRPTNLRNFQLRALRYGITVFAGYLLGLSAGSLASRQSPSFWMLGSVGALALFLVFRRGVRSQSDAAIDAVLEATATATATATQSVIVAGGHVVGASPADSHVYNDSVSDRFIVGQSVTELPPADPIPVPGPRSLRSTDPWLSTRER